MPSSTTSTTSTPHYVDGGADSEKWTPSQPTTLESLLAIVDGPSNGDDGSDVRPVPWRSGHALRITGTGGLHDLEQRRVSIAPGGYSRQTLKNLTLNVTGNYDLTVDGTETLSIGPQSSLSGTSDQERLAGTAWGRDRLVVRGEASMAAKDRMTLMSGTYQRFWNGRIVKLAGMEGVICGGAFVRAHAGPSMTVAALCSGDVYGGAARATGLRTYVAAAGYRAAVSAVWACGAYVRATSFTVTPTIDSPSEKAPTKNLAKKAGRILLSLVPFFDIAAGVIMAPIGILGLIKGIYNKIKKKPAPPPSGPPRTLVRNCLVRKEAATTIVQT